MILQALGTLILVIAAIILIGRLSYQEGRKRGVFDTELAIAGRQLDARHAPAATTGPLRPFPGIDPIPAAYGRHAAPEPILAPLTDTGALRLRTDTWLAEHIPEPVS